MLEKWGDWQVFFVYAQKFSAGLCIFPLQSSALLFCHIQNTQNDQASLARLRKPDWPFFCSSLNADDYSYG